MDPQDLLRFFFFSYNEITSCFCFNSLLAWGAGAVLAQIVYAERPLTDNNRSLASYGLKDGDVVILRHKETVEPRPSMRFPGETGPVLLLLHLRGSSAPPSTSSGRVL